MDIQVNNKKERSEAQINKNKKIRRKQIEFFKYIVNVKT